jgi:hypothetical protein
LRRHNSASEDARTIPQAISSVLTIAFEIAYRLATCLFLCPQAFASVETGVHVLSEHVRSMGFCARRRLVRSKLYPVFGCSDMRLSEGVSRTPQVRAHHRPALLVLPGFLRLAAQVGGKAASTLTIRPPALLPAPSHNEPARYLTPRGLIHQKCSLRLREWHTVILKD